VSKRSRQDGYTRTGRVKPWRLTLERAGCSNYAKLIASHPGKKEIKACLSTIGGLHPRVADGDFLRSITKTILLMEAVRVLLESYFMENLE
jgi:hypothetical protein